MLIRVSFSTYMYQVDIADSPPLLSQSLGHSGEGPTSRGPSLFVSLSMSYTSSDPENGGKKKCWLSSN